jgi:hypothetical protein
MESNIIDGHVNTMDGLFVYSLLKEANYGKQEESVQAGGGVSNLEE